jgi:hypothetical protein
LNRHIRAIRAFHTGLIAESHRRIHLLRKMAPHIDLLRRPALREEKLQAAEESCRHLQALGDLRQPWHSTYRDLRRHLLALRAHLRRLLRSPQPD